MIRSIFIIFLGLGCIASPAFATPNDPAELLAQAFLNARKLRVNKRLTLIEQLAQESNRNTILEHSNPQELLPTPKQLQGASWVALLNAGGEKVASRGLVPSDIGTHIVVRRALSAFLRDDLIESSKGPLYIAAAPLGKEGRVVGALIVAWPESLDLQELAMQSCGCEVLLFSKGMLVTNMENDDPLLLSDIKTLLEKTSPTPGILGSILPPSPLRNHPEVQGAIAWLPGSAKSVAYVLLFPVQKESVNSTSFSILLGFFIGLSLLSGTLLVWAWFFGRNQTSLNVGIPLLASAPSIHNASIEAFQERIPSLYEEFIAAKIRCGEETDFLDKESFAKTVQDSYAHLAGLHQQAKLRFTVVIRHGRAQILASPDL